jgi:type II secretory pathway component PulF
MKANGPEVTGETNRVEGLWDRPWPSASIWLFLWACWGYGVFHVIPTMAEIYAQKNLPLEGPTAMAVNLAAFMRQPWIAVPAGIAVVGWVSFLVFSRCRTYVHPLAWTANIIIFISGITALVALFWELLDFGN